jgi:hypothetical protein
MMGKVGYTSDRAQDGRGVLWRRCSRVFATLAPAMAVIVMVDNALTVRHRALAANLSEFSAVPGVEKASWVAALMCAAVLLGVAARALGGRRRPRLGCLWLAGGASVAFAYLVAMWTASLWV